MPRPRAAWLGASLLVWCAATAAVLSRTNGSLLGFSDHYSHYSTAILFYHHGFEIYRQPVEQLCPIRGTEALSRYARSKAASQPSRWQACASWARD